MPADPLPPADDPHVPPPANAAFLVMALGRRVRRQVEARLRASRLTPRHLPALGHLAGRPDLSYSDLARRAGVTAQSMQATVTHLEQLGAVERTTRPGRGRPSQLRVTDEGRRLLRAGTVAMADAEEELLGALDVEQRRRFTADLSVLFRASIDRPPPDGPGSR